MFEQRWLMYAILSALSASMVGIFGKFGMKEVDSTLATVVRSIVMTVFLIAAGLVLGASSKLGTLHPKAMLAIILSGVAGAVSWLFYFKAIQVGTVSQVAPIDKLSMPLAVVLAVIILGDRPTWVNWTGILLIAGGAYLASIPRPH
ncbi:MAG: putative rane protein [Phycisphaerales bacterium]|nr:putative rane protein [Phycisphaerales bacterium]